MAEEDKYWDLKKALKNNQSQQDVINQKDKKEDFVIEKADTFKNLSEKQCVSIATTEPYYFEGDVKQFIKLLKEDYDKRIDAVQKEFKTTTDPMIAVERYQLMKVLCGFVDKIDRLAGDKLTQNPPK